MIFYNILYFSWSECYFWKHLFLFRRFLTMKTTFSYFPGMFENPEPVKIICLKNRKHYEIFIYFQGLYFYGKAFFGGYRWENTNMMCICSIYLNTFLFSYDIFCTVYLLWRHKVFISILIIPWKENTMHTVFRSQI